MSDRVTIKSIARDLGISHMTVSRALSGHPRVLAETRSAVLARAEAAGYVRSPAAAAMRRARTRILGLVVPGLVNEFYARLAHLLASGAAAQGHHLVIHVTDEDPERQAVALGQLAALGAECAAVVGVPGATAAAPFPVLHLIRRGPEGAPFLGIDDAEAIGAAVARLAERGARRIGYIGGWDALPTGRGRRDAFVSALAGLGRAPGPWIRLGPPRLDFGRSACRALLAEGIDGLVCGGVETSAGALDAALEAGVELPGRLAFVGYGDPPPLRWLAGGVTTIALPAEELAERTLDRLMGRDPGAGVPRARLTLRATA